MNKGFFVFFLTCLGVAVLNAQPNTVELPKVLRPSPDAAALGKYGDIPVNYQTGIPNIIVPIYEIKTSKLSLPIDISYHAGGFRVNEIASSTGLGWSLNAGGAISRVVKGFPDESAYGILNTGLTTYADVTANKDHYWLQATQMMWDGQDVESDEYNYNLLSQSGKFVWDANKQPYLIPYKPIDITFTNNTQFPSGYFTIKDEQGNIYTFSDAEKTENVVPGSSQVYTSAWYLTSIISYDLSDTISFQYVNKTFYYESSSNYSEEFGNKQTGYGGGMLQYDYHGYNNSSSTVKYTPKVLQSIIFKNGKVDFSFSEGRSDIGTNAGPKLDSINIYQRNSTGAYTKVKFFKLTFGYFDSNVGTTVTTSYRLKLLKVNEFSAANEPGKEYSFDYDALLLPDRGSNARDMWGFYNGKTTNQTLVKRTSVRKSYNNLLTTIGQADRDPYGAYIGASLLNKITYPTGGYTSFEFEPHKINFRYTQALESDSIRIIASAIGGSLPSQNYVKQSFTADVSIGAFITVYIQHYGGYSGVTQQPKVSLKDVTTGGVSTYYSTPTQDLAQTYSISLVSSHQYELIAEAYQNFNIYAEGIITYPAQAATSTAQNIIDAGGMRIKAIKSYSSSGVIVNTTEYKYGTNEDGIGTLLVPDNLFSVNYYLHDYLVTFLQPNCQTAGCCNIYNYTLKTFPGTSMHDFSNFGGSTVLYKQVTQYQGSVTNNSGKSIYYYDPIIDNVGFVSTYFNLGGIKTVSNSWKNGMLKKEEHYRNDNTSFYKLKESFYTYNYLQSTQSFGLITGLKVIDLGGECVAGPTSEAFEKARYFWSEFPIYTGKVLLRQKLEREFDPINPANNLVKTTDYTYDNLTHIQPTKIATTISTGEKRQTEIMYSTDYIGLTATDNLTLGIKNLQNKHIFSPIEKREYLSNSDGSNNRLITAAFTAYKGDQPVPDGIFNIENASPLTNFNISSVQSGAITKDANYKQQVVFNSYDASNNILELQKTNNIKLSYVWDYKSSLPVAEVNNATQSDIAYTSFEADGKGNWVFTGTPVSNFTSPTGKKVYSLATGAISKSGLTTANTYTLSYWTNNNTAYSITGTQANYPIQGRSVNGWTYFEHRIAGQSQVSISGNGLIDEVRLYPFNALMSTYTYEPIIGISSQCDANNRITYYEYEASARLRLIRDQDKNIIKKICYNYSGQPENCTDIITYANQIQSQQFRRNNCSAGYLGSYVTYTVPAGVYTSTISQSDADQQAQNDLTANGPAYANANGTCIATSCSFTVASGWTNYSSTVTPGGNSVTITIVVSGNNSSSFTNINSGKVIGNISGSCRPNLPQTRSCTAAGRTWSMTISPGGDVIIRLVTGTVPYVNQQLQFNTLNYPLTQ